MAHTHASEYHSAVHELGTNPSKVRMLGLLSSILSRAFQQNPLISLLIKQVIKRARDGSILACIAIRNAMTSKKLPSAALSEAMEVLVGLIKDGCPPEQVALDKFHLAEVAFASMSTALALHLSEMENPPVAAVLECWSSILMWAKARYIQNVRANERLYTAPQEGWFHLAVFIDGIGLLQQRKVLQNAASEPRLLELAMHLYLSSQTKSQFIKIAMGYLSSYIEQNGIRDSDVVIGHYRTALDDLQSAALGSPEVLLKPVLSLLRDADRAGIPLLSALHCCYDILCRFVAIRDHPIAMNVAEKGLSSISNGLRLLTSTTPKEQGTDEFAHAYSLCLSLFANFSHQVDGKVWLMEALQYRIFHVFATSSALLSKAPGKRLLFMTELLSHRLPASLYDPAIIFACEDALFTLSTEDHKKIMASTFTSAWETFIHRFFEQYVFYCYFEIAGYHKGCYKCGATAGNDKVALRRCGACRNVEYCSSDCQMSDWKEHRKGCKTLKNRKYGPLPLWASPLFVRRLASHDARRHLPGIRALAAKHFPCFPLQCTCLTVFYEIFPPLMDITLVKERKLTYDQLAREASDPVVRDPCFDDIRLHDGSSGILENVQVGTHVESLFHHFLWSPPYFASAYGTMCPTMRASPSIVSPYTDSDGHELSTTWSVVDEIAYRGDLSPQMIFDGKMGDIRRKVLEVVVREKARMRSGPC